MAVFADADDIEERGNQSMHARKLHLTARASAAMKPNSAEFRLPEKSTRTSFVQEMDRNSAPANRASSRSMAC
ncbi:MAG: hypothetical protein MZW92_43900 [Comamonadaceae bacterium]|nr:hypothetical protein [Comamonadaceae bacterium]